MKKDCLTTFSKVDFKEKLRCNAAKNNSDHFYGDRSYCIMKAVS